VTTPDAGSSTFPPPLTTPPCARPVGTRIAVALAVAYTVAIVVVTAGLRFVGESWWVTTAGLYLPRIGFALPLPLAALLLLVAGPRRLLWLLLVPTTLLLFPLMGLQVGRGLLVKTAQAARPTLRIVSYNISSADHAQQVAETIASARADVVLLQEWDVREARHVAKLRGYRSHFAGQFGILSRFPISEVHVPPKVTIPGAAARPAEFIRYRIETGLGPVTVFNVHPLSPRDSLAKFGKTRFLRQPRPPKVDREQGIAELKQNALMRWRQAEAIAEAAGRIAGPVIIAGDTNLPGLSRIYAQTLAPFQDGFAEVGRGFGYTFPAAHPWMRIDRILARPPLMFQRFDVLPGAGSDHLAIAAELTSR
jgi:vancomycin resistance protein VanJ